MDDPLAANITVNMAEATNCVYNEVKCKFLL